MEDPMNKGKNLQDVYLNVARKEKIDVTIYLMNGVPLNGRVISFDNFTILFEIDRKHNLVYKHAVSTVVPSKPIVLRDDE
jgi:host factor-I protein